MIYLNPAVQGLLPRSCEESGGGLKVKDFSIRDQTGSARSPGSWRYNTRNARYGRHKEKNSQLCTFSGHFKVI